ncbi:hypothetical protein C494_15518 [Natronorubrum bangense JCM 10635]|uniref:Uncharacterized protein n=1 Tax=Natronorubrum bangense JCM 10635 TaxID=1227500 RepID=L9WAF6_9EURY|nr:hypothetical protein C494_15518 [Natronorubrum bangense JCM 10635]
MIVPSACIQTLAIPAAVRSDPLSWSERLDPSLWSVFPAEGGGPNSIAHDWLVAIIRAGFTGKNTLVQQ